MSSPGKRNDKPRRRPQDTDWSAKPDWGGVARRGAARVDPKRGRTSGIGPPKSRPEESEDRPPMDEGRRERVDETEQWILESVEVEAHGAVRRGSRPRARRPSGREEAPEEISGGSQGSKAVSQGLFDDLGSAKRAEVLSRRLDEASRAYSRERYGDALKILRPLAQEAPGVAEVRELMGLTYYRQGRWKDAMKELRAFATMTGSTEQHPVLADCARALKRYRAVEEYWDALRQDAPSADLVAEGRMVMAGALADRNDFEAAIALMEAGRRKVKKPKERHLRMAYMLADLHERAGDLPAARSGFRWLASYRPDFGDVADRLAALH